jgi:signal transduction histidine kinase
MRLATLKSQSTANVTQLRKNIASTQRLVQKSVDIVHRFARDLRPSVLDDLGLIPALESYIKSFMKETRIRAGFTAFAGVEKLDIGRRTVLYRVAQEALSNIASHAKASTAKTSIVNNAGTVCMEITDNGRGFQMEGASFVRNSKRLGLLGMRERVEMVGGTFCVESEPGKGTTVRVEIPSGKRSTTKRPSRLSGKNATLNCP